MITLGVRLEDFNSITKHMCGRCRDLAEDLMVVQVEEIPQDNLLKLRRNICKTTGLSLAELMGRCRKAHLVSARRIFAKKAQQMGFSYPQIGKAICRHHSSVIHLVCS